jgi:hypothetical protein
MKTKRYMTAWFEAVRLRDEPIEKGLKGSFEIFHDRLTKEVKLIYSEKEIVSFLDCNNRILGTFRYGYIM